MSDNRNKYKGIYFDFLKELQSLRITAMTKYEIFGAYCDLSFTDFDDSETFLNIIAQRVFDKVIPTIDRTPISKKFLENFDENMLKHCKKVAACEWLLLVKSITDKFGGRAFHPTFVVGDAEELFDYMASLVWNEDNKTSLN